MRHDDPMINTISKTQEAQEKTQDIKQSPSTKIETKPYAGSQRNELTEVTGRWRKVTGRSDQEARQTGVSSSDRTLDRTLAANRPDAGQQSLVEYKEVPERRNYDRMRPMAGDRTLAVSDQVFAAPTVGTTGCVWSGCIQRPVSSRKAGLRLQRLLS